MSGWTGRGDYRGEVYVCRSHTWPEYQEEKKRGIYALARN